MYVYIYRILQSTSWADDEDNKCDNPSNVPFASHSDSEDSTSTQASKAPSAHKGSGGKSSNKGKKAEVRANLVKEIWESYN